MSATAHASQEQDLAAIRKLVEDADAFQTDTERFTGLMAEDVVLVNFAGIRVKGREQLRQAMAKAMETPLARVFTRNEILDVTFVRPNVALVSCLKRISDENDGATGTFPAKGIMTFVMVSEGDAWRIASAQTTPIAD
jgi:uncharacterized protein (TIGR02246 family)